jgi:hypothetical protein
MDPTPTPARPAKLRATARGEAARLALFLAVELAVQLLRRRREGEGAGLMSWPPMAALLCAGWSFLIHRRLTFRDFAPPALGLLAPFLAASLAAYVVEALGGRIGGETAMAAIGAWALGVGVKYALVRMAVWPPRAAKGATIAAATGAAARSGGEA